jgi:hypothetical protein
VVLLIFDPIRAIITSTKVIVLIPPGVENPIDVAGLEANMKGNLFA